MTRKAGKRRHSLSYGKFSQRSETQKEQAKNHKSWVVGLYKAKRMIGPFWVLVFSPGMTYLFERYFSISGFYRTLFYSVLLILFLGAIRQLFLLNKEIALSREFIEVRKYFFEKQRIPISNIDNIVTDSMSEGRYVLGVKLLGSESLKVSYIDLEYLKEPEEFISELGDMINP